MSLTWDRTSFDKGHAKVFHVCAYGATYYTDLCRKYGGEYVFRAVSATAEDVAIRNAIGKCVTGRNDLTRIYPGTYTFAAVVTVDKGCTIESATGNAGDVVLDLATSDVAGFSITAAGVTIRNLSITGEDAAGATIAIASTGDATVLDNLTIVATVTTTGAVIDLDGDRSVVRNCNIGNAIAAVQIDGSSCRVEGNMIYSTSTAGVGIELTGSTTGKNTACIVKDNILNLRGGTGDVGIKVAAASTHCVADNNGFALGLDLVKHRQTIVFPRPHSQEHGRTHDPAPSSRCAGHQRAGRGIRRRRSSEIGASGHCAFPRTSPASSPRRR